MAHMYEEEMAVYGRSDLMTKAIQEYRLAIEADPTSQYLTAGLAELYARTGRIRDAVSEAQEILQRDPNNLEAHRLLGHIYLRSLGDMQGGSSSDSVLKLAIQQYEEIVKLDPSSADDHIMLGRLYHADNQTKKAEEEEKIAIKQAPESEEAVTSLAMLAVALTLQTAAINKRLDDMRDLWRAELRRVEEVLDARLKHFEDKLGIR